jgi:hypothetical protein
MPGSLNDGIFAFLYIFPGFVLACTFYNFFSALTAHFFGDRTPKNEGFLTLNPSVHVDILGSALFWGAIILTNTLFKSSILSGIVFLIVIFSGLRRTIDVPINPDNFKDPILGEALSLLAGPIGAMFFSFCAMLLMRLGEGSFFTVEGITTLGSLQNHVWQFLDFGSTIGIFLGVLSLIPLPPQPAGRIILLLIPEEHEDFIEWYSSYGLFILLGLLIIPGVAEGFSNFLLLITGGIKTMFHILVFRTF